MITDGGIMTDVAGIFDNQLSADRAVSALLDEGFSKDDISLLMTDKTHHRLFSSTDDEANRVAKGGVAGAAIGGALGALLAGLGTVGIIVVPGAGLMAVGPLVAALSGAGAGATIGGLSGALIRAGFAADDANRFEEEIKNGKAVVIVHAHGDDKETIARSVLADAGAVTEMA
jgi:uncharacterized Rossmann fold enzyme